MLALLERTRRSLPPASRKGRSGTTATAKGRPPIVVSRGAGGGCWDDVLMDLGPLRRVRRRLGPLR
jgi:hypothetical protein